MNNNLVKSKIKLTIGMLVSNHIQYIRNCMEAIKPLLDAVPSELVVVDTKGSETDGSIAVVREYTDRIYPFIWCNDFSAARNVCMEHARGEWFLYFDDDEWFDDVQEFIDFFQSGEYEHYMSGFYYTRDYRFDGSYSMGIAGRMVRRQKDTHFVGKVHEEFNFMTEPVKMFSCFTHHQGYVFMTEDDRRKHRERNMEILREELKEKGETPKLCAQMVQELMGSKESRLEGIAYCEESIELLKQKGELMNTCTQWLLTIKLKYLCTKDDYAATKEQAEYLQKNYSLSQMARQAIAGLMVYAATKAKDMETIVVYAKLYRQMHQWLLNHPQEKPRQVQLDLTDYDTKEYAIRTFWTGAVACNETEQYEDAYIFWKELPWREEDFDGSCFSRELVKTLRNIQDKKPYLQYCRNFYKEELFCPECAGYLPKECRELIK